MNFDWSQVGEAQAPINRLAGVPVELLTDDEITRLTKVDPYDLEPVRAKLEPYEELLAAMKEEAEAIEVADDASAERATALGVQCRKIEKAVEEARSFFKRPALDFGQSIDNLARVYTTKAQAAAGTLSRKVAAFHNKKKQEELARLKKEQEEAAKLQAKLNAEAKATKTDPVQVVIPKAPVAVGPIRSENGKAVIATKWVCIITDPALVPRAYCEPVQKLLNDAVRAGIREIPGCKIEEQSTARFGA